MRHAWTHKFQSSGPTVYSLYCGWVVNYAIDVLLIDGPITGSVYKLCCESHYGLLNLRNEVWNEVRNIKGKVLSSTLTFGGLYLFSCRRF